MTAASTGTPFKAEEPGPQHKINNRLHRNLTTSPTESSSGQSRSQGSITKTGNTHARRLLVEAAWHHAKPYRVPGKTMRDRWELAPPAARVRGHEGNRRLHQRWQRFNARKKRPAVADVAIARELAGWAWSLALLE